MSKPMLEVFSTQLLNGIDSDTALNYTIADVSRMISEEVANGVELEEALQHFNLDRELGKSIRRTLPNVKVMLPLMMAIRTVIHTEGLPCVPTRECLLKHLPKGRKPTYEEIEAAWEACKNQ
jgi:hypothetical protein